MIQWMVPFYLTCMGLFCSTVWANGPLVHTTEIDSLHTDFDYSPVHGNGSVLERSRSSRSSCSIVLTDTMGSEESIRFSMRSCHDLTIQLRAQPSAGFSWSLRQPYDNSFLKLIGSDAGRMTCPIYAESAFIKTEIVGAPCEQIFHFEKWMQTAQPIHPITLFFDYSRSWESDFRKSVRIVIDV